jgi:hypothetical protein
MKKTIYTLMVVIFITLPSMTTNAQNYSDQAKIYFAKHLTSKSMIELIAKSLPTLDDCKLVFKGQNAYTYFGVMEEMKSKLSDELQKEDETFVDIGIETFSTQDIEQSKGNYAGGMKNIVDKLQTYVTFYKVELLREKGAEMGVAYKYWVNLNGRWVYFPKPYAAFKK